MSSPKPQASPEDQIRPPASQSVDLGEQSTPETAIHSGQNVLLSDVAESLPASQIVFEFDTTAGGPPKGVADRAGGEIFYEGETVPNITFSACKPGCNHSEIEHMTKSGCGGDVEVKHINPRATGNVSLSLPGRSIEIRGARKLPPKDSGREQKGALCETCRSVDFWALQSGVEHRMYGDLEQQADGCDFCGLLLDSVLEPENFVPNLNKRISLHKLSDCGSQFISKIEVRYPSVEKDRAEAADKDATSMRCTELDIFVDNNNPYRHYFTGRSIGPADNPAQISQWLHECTTEHEYCAEDARMRGVLPSLEAPLLPKRVVNVGGNDEHPEPFLFESGGTRGQYLSLSHRWGGTNMSTTTKALLEDHTRRIGFNSLCKTFQDAITITRKLGFQYIWIDALCIIQDSEEDWGEEASKMADIYHSATITLSASRADSGDSGLIYPREKPRVIQLPLRIPDEYPDKTLACSVAARYSSSFEDDVERGTLAKRAWCLQERVLPLRIVHFGHDQLHWECLSTAFSESSTTKVNPSGAVPDMRKALAAADADWQQQRGKLVKNMLPEDGRLKQIYGRGHYGKWYQMITEYTKREITKETDRLPALAGLAQAWAQRTGEIYACGLWNEDLAVGLLWSGSSFYAPYGSPSNLRRPSERIAPSWSWLSLDGPVDYPLGKLGPVDIERPWFVGSPDKATLSSIGPSGPAFIKITGRARPLVTMRSFSQGVLSHLAQNHQNYPPDHIPRIAFDEQGKYDFRELWCLLVAFRGCGSKSCNHHAACELGFAYGLVLWPNVQTGCCRRVGIAQTFQSDWEGVAKDTIVLE